MNLPRTGYCGICAASASGNVLILDKNNRPITPIISWQDKRVTNEAKEVLGEYNNDKLYDLIGWPFRQSASFGTALLYKSTIRRF